MTESLSSRVHDLQRQVNDLLVRLAKIEDSHAFPEYRHQCVTTRRGEADHHNLLPATAEPTPHISPFASHQPGTLTTSHSIARLWQGQGSRKPHARAAEPRATRRAATTKVTVPGHPPSPARHRRADTTHCERRASRGREDAWRRTQPGDPESRVDHG